MLPECRTDRTRHAVSSMKFPLQHALRHLCLPLYTFWRTLQEPFFHRDKILSLREAHRYILQENTKELY